jgi:ATP-dependent DNA helicase DinG
LRSLDAGKAFAEKLAALHRGGLFVGSSLSLNDGNQKHFAQRLGLTHFEAPVRFGSEAPPSKERLALLMPFAPAPQGADSAKHLAELLARLLKEMPMPVVIFAPSHTVIKALREGLAAQLPDRLVIAQAIDGQRDNLAFLYKQAANPILIGQDWPVELADAEGKKPNLWVMARIPFAPPSDAMIAARSEIVQQSGKHPLFDLLVPEAASRLKDLVQKHRRTGEKQVIWMTDPRLARERYGAFMTRAMTQDIKTCGAESQVAEETLSWLNAANSG